MCHNLNAPIRLFGCFLLMGAGALAQTVTSPNPTASLFKNQDYQPPSSCLPCHQRQYDELRSSVKSGYRNVSPLFNGLESAGNFLTGGLLRPVYGDSTKLNPDGSQFNSNMFTTRSFTTTNQVRAGFCFTCHNPHIEAAGEDPTKREVPEIETGAKFRPDLFHPLRDYHLVDANGKQVLPAEFGGDPPAGAQPSLAAHGITCDLCHNLQGADKQRSMQNDGFANMSILLNHTIEKVGPFPFPVAVKGNFHVASNDQAKISFLRSGAFCNTCHDVRVPLPTGDLSNYEAYNGSAGASGKVTYFRLENLSTEWQNGPYNSSDNPFGKVVRCQDCHMSLFPFTAAATYKVGNMTVTSPTPGVFAQNFAAVPGVSTDQNFPLPKRPVVNHNFTGVDVPLLYPAELKARLGADYPDPYEPGNDEYGIPKSLAKRRAELLNAAVRIELVDSDKQAKLGEEFKVRVNAVSLTGHRFPSGFSQERTAYIQLKVTDANGILLYQSGYQVDKPHPDTGENAPDGNLDDEDLEHLIAVIDGGTKTDVYKPGTAGPNGSLNSVYVLGPDNGPDARVYGGSEEGLVLFRNELTKVFFKGENLGHPTNGSNIIPAQPHYEETFNAAITGVVDNFRSLSPLRPTVYRYKIKLPTKDELGEMGIDHIAGPLQVSAQVNYEHFPPVFVRFIARVTGPNGPAGHSLHLMDEKRLDDLVHSNRAIATAVTTVSVEE
jgi:hypothetical protein